MFDDDRLMPLPLTVSCSSKSRLVLPSWFYFSGTGWPGWSRTQSRGHSLTNQDSCPTRRTAARPIPEGRRSFVYSQCKLFFWWFHSFSIIISIEQLSVYSKIFLISRCKKFVIPLVLGPTYMFYAHRSAMFTIDQTIELLLIEWTNGRRNTDILFCTVPGGRKTFVVVVVDDNDMLTLCSYVTVTGEC